MLITVDRLVGLQNLLLKYCTRIEWKATLTDGTTVTFDSFEEMKNNSNFGRAKILGITAFGRSDDFKTIINVTLSREYPTLKRFGDCSFKFDSEDQHTVFRNEIENFFDKCVEGELSYQTGRWISVLLLLGIVLFATFSLFQIPTEKTILTGVFVFMLTGFTLWLSIMVSTKVWDHIFPSIVFAIGEEEKRYEKRKKTFSSIFWCVIVAAIVAIVVNRYL